VRALLVAVTFMDQARAWKHDTDLGNRLNPEVYDEGFWSRVDAWAGQLGLTGPVGIVQASEVPGAG
jgi:hypothetical protein